MSRLKPSPINGDDAEALALQALTFLLSDGARMSRFLSLTGIAPEGLREAAASRALQAATLEYLLGDESLLLMFCQEAGIAPASVAPAHAVLLDAAS